MKGKVWQAVKPRPPRRKRKKPGLCVSLVTGKIYDPATRRVVGENPNPPRVNLRKATSKKPSGGESSCQICRAITPSENAILVTYPPVNSDGIIQSAQFCSAPCAHKAGFTWITRP